MKKRIRAAMVSALFALAMVCSAAPAAADTGTEAFDALKAILEQNGGTYTLTSDMSLSDNLHCKQNATIDLGGYTLSTGGYTIAVYNSTLTVRNGTMSGSGMLLQAGEMNDKNTPFPGTLNIEGNAAIRSFTRNAVYVGPDSTLNMTSGSVTAPTSAIICEGTVNLDGGTVSATGTQAVTVRSRSVIQVYENMSEEQKNYYGTLNIRNEAVTVTAPRKAIAVEPSSSANISSGTVTANEEAILSNGNTVISGGTVTATGESAVTVGYRGNVKIRGGNIQAQDYTLFIQGEAEISGGTVYASGEEATALYVEGGSKYTEGVGIGSTGIAEVTGGTVYTDGNGAMTAYLTGDSRLGIPGTLKVQGGTLRADGEDGAAVYLDEMSSAVVKSGSLSATADGTGGQGVYVNSSRATLKISGGTISADTCGVMVGSQVTPAIFLSGNPAFHTGDEENCDIELLNLNTLIRIDGAMTNTTPISVRLGGDRADEGAGGVFTANYSQYNPEEDPGQYFTDVSGNAAGWADENHLEACLAGHQHAFVYFVSEDQTTITAQCLNEGCILNEDDLTLELIAPDRVYDESGKPVTWNTGCYLAAFPELESGIHYYVFDDDTNDWDEVGGVPAEPGEYMAEYTGAAEVAEGIPTYANIVYEIVECGIARIRPWSSDAEPGTLVGGIRFRVEIPEDPGWGYDEWISDQYSPKTLRYLEPGVEYVLYAADMPDGYMVPEEIWFGCDNEFNVWSDPEGLVSDGDVINLQIERGYRIDTDGTAEAYVRDDTGEETAITQAPAGTTVYADLSLNENALNQLEDGCYFTGAFEVNDQPLGYDEDGIPVTQFEMPECDVTISATQALQETGIILDYTESSALEAPGRLFIQMEENEEMESLLSENEAGDLIIDLDASGKYDIAVIPGEAGFDGLCSINLLGGCDAFGEYVFEFYGATDRYAGFTAVIPAPVFGPADFTLPGNLAEIEESAFEGDPEIRIVYIGDFCTAIGKNAFAGCTNLTQIRLPENCEIDGEAFDVNGLVTVFAPAGGTTEAWCRSHGNAVFVEE